MIRWFVVLVALAAALVAAVENAQEEYQKEYIADKEYLHKQKLVYDVLYHFTQPKLNTELYEIGQNYNLVENINSFTDKAAVDHFLKHLEYGLIHHDAVYSVYYYPEETLNVFKVLYSAKDFETFYKAALYMRNRVNHSLFAYVFYLAVIHRPDTKYIRLPPLNEMIPYMFYNSEFLEQVHHYEYFGQKENKQNGREVYTIPYNYSGHYVNDDYESSCENSLDYLTEDIAWNEYYFYFRNQFPFLVSSALLGLSDKYRGEEYLYGHKQIMSRYNLERMANGLGHVEHFDYHGKFYPGYYPRMTYPTGLPFPVRAEESDFPKYKLHDIMYAMKYESRIMDAVDAGFILNKEGKQVNIYTPEGLNILGNLLEGNADTANSQYYGNVDELIRHILGFNFEPTTRYQAHPSALEHFSTSMRDPAIYRLYSKLLHHYIKYYENQGPYKSEEIQFPNLQIESVNVEKLETFFDYFDSTVNNGLVAPTKQIADSVLVKAHQYRLNHKPFSVNVTINAAEAIKAVVKIFIGPKYDVHGRKIELSSSAFENFYEIDSFIYDLKSGMNSVIRDNMAYTIADITPTEEYYQSVVKALESDAEFKYQKRIYGFPNRLILPKGKPEGMPMQLFVYVAPVLGEPSLVSSPIFGDNYVDNRPMGFPLNRPVVAHDFVAPNMLFKEVHIYHNEKQADV